MVHRTRLLLSAALVLGGCKAESLGVQVVRGGPEAISMEDLQRDAWLVGGGEGKDGWAGFEHRLQQMHTLPAFGRSYRGRGADAVVCGRKDGRGDRIFVVLAVNEGAGAGLLRLASLISLTKAWDVQRPPPETLIFCGVDGPAGLQALLGAAVAPQDAVTTAFVLGGPPQWGAGLGNEVVALELGDLPPDPGAIDFRVLQQAVVAADTQIREKLSAP